MTGPLKDLPASKDTNRNELFKTLMNLRGLIQSFPVQHSRHSYKMYFLRCFQLRSSSNKSYHTCRLSDYWTPSCHRCAQIIIKQKTCLLGGQNSSLFWGCETWKPISSDWGQDVQDLPPYHGLRTLRWLDLLACTATQPMWKANWAQKRRARSKSRHPPLISTLRSPAVASEKALQKRLCSRLS